MNKIEEIAVEAGLIVGEYNGFDRGMLTATELRFAELIVKKIMQVAANNLPQNAYLDVAEAVIEYFEVLREIEGPHPMGCPRCGCPGPIMGTGDCNCGED